MAAPRPFLESPRTAFGLLAGYFLLHVILRSLVSDSLQTDEAEQCLVTQVWLWGYGSQPPLYTWLQIPIFAAFGVNVFALSILKNSLLFSIYLFTYLSAREIFHETRHALIATFSLLLIILFAWESQRDQTHLVLATAVATATLYVAVRLVKTRSLGWYCLLGVLAALGLLAKYNYAVMILSFLLAAFSLSTFRPAILDRKILLTLACFLLVISPHAYWAWTNPELLLSQANKFNIPESGNFLHASLIGGGLMLKRILDFIVGPLVVFSLLYFRAPRIAEASADRRLVELIQRMMLIGLGLCLLAVLAFHVTAIRARWLQPLLISLPLVAVAWAQPRLDAWRIKAIFALSLVVMLAVPVTLYGPIAAAGWLGRTSNLNVPYRTFASRIRATGFTNGLIVCDGHLVAGNLRLQFPKSIIEAAGNIPVPVPMKNQLPLIVVWRPTDKATTPGDFLKGALREFDIDPAKSREQTISAPALYAPNNLETLCFALLITNAVTTNLSASQGSAMQ